MITSLSDDSMTHRRYHSNDLESVYHRLNTFIDNVNEKINSRIELVKQVYLDDYKEQVSIMAGQLKSIRGVLDEEILKQRSNDKLFYLEEERDFFRAQVIKLNEDLRNVSLEKDRLKGQLSETQHECANFKTIVYELETKIYKLTYENLEMDKMRGSEKKISSVPTTLSNTAKTLREPRRSYLQSLRQNQTEEDRLSHCREHNKHSLHKLKKSPSLGTEGAQLLKARAILSRQCSKREQILDDCIKEMKKQIYYRNIHPRESNKLHFDENEKVSFERFTKTDRKEVVFRLMSDPEILDQFYTFIFAKKNYGKEEEMEGGSQLEETYPQSRTSKTLSKISLVKGLDSKFNTKALSGFKAEFDKRIFDIKANRI